MMEVDHFTVQYLLLYTNAFWKFDLKFLQSYAKYSDFLERTMRYAVQIWDSDLP